MPREMTAITQVHAYIKERYKPGDIITTSMIHNGLRHLTNSAVSAALWKLGTEGILLAEYEDNGKIYMVDTQYMMERGFEDREAPEPGKKRNRKRKKEKSNA